MQCLRTKPVYNTKHMFLWRFGLKTQERLNHNNWELTEHKPH